jgi:hypothetical protein
VCPITGTAAPYRDPRTGVPFATLKAYSVITKILNHEYVWSPTLGCYMAPYDVAEGTQIDNEGSGNIKKGDRQADGRRRGR